MTFLIFIHLEHETEITDLMIIRSPTSPSDIHPIALKTTRLYSHLWGNFEMTDLKLVWQARLLSVFSGEYHGYHRGGAADSDLCAQSPAFIPLRIVLRSIESEPRFFQ